jgi:hypothetical protein
MPDSKNTQLSDTEQDDVPSVDEILELAQLLQEQDFQHYQQHLQHLQHLQHQQHQQQQLALEEQRATNILHYILSFVLVLSGVLPLFNSRALEGVSGFRLFPYLLYECLLSSSQEPTFSSILKTVLKVAFSTLLAVANCTKLLELGFVLNVMARGKKKLLSAVAVVLTFALMVWIGTFCSDDRHVIGSSAQMLSTGVVFFINQPS